MSFEFWHIEACGQCQALHVWYRLDGWYLLKLNLGMN